MSFKVAVLGHGGERDGFMYYNYGIQVFDLSVDQIFSLLQDPDINKGVDGAKVGAVPTAQYQVQGGGRFFPSVTREEIAQVMQGVDVMLMPASVEPYNLNFMAAQFYEGLIQDNLLDQCKAVVLRIAEWKPTEQWHKGLKPLTVDTLLTQCGLSKAQNLKKKLYVLADKEVKMGRRWKGKKAKKDADMTTSASRLRAFLQGEEVKEAVVAPVKETVSAGKAVINMGQRFSSWLASLVKS